MQPKAHSMDEINQCVDACNLNKECSFHLKTLSALEESHLPEDFHGRFCDKFYMPWRLVILILSFNGLVNIFSKQYLRLYYRRNYVYHCDRGVLLRMFLPLNLLNLFFRFKIKALRPNVWFQVTIWFVYGIAFVLK